MLSGVGSRTDTVTSANSGSVAICCAVLGSVAICYAGLWSMVGCMVGMDQGVLLEWRLMTLVEREWTRETVAVILSFSTSPMVRIH